MCRMHARQRGCGRIVPWIKAPLFNSVMPQSLRRTCPVGAVVQEGWLPFKRLQRSGQSRRKAPQGGPLAPIANQPEGQRHILIDQRCLNHD